MAHSIPFEWWRRDSAPAPTPVPVSAHTSGPHGRVAYGCLVAFTVMLVASPQQYFPIPEELRLALAFAVVGLAALVVDIVRAPRPRNKMPTEFALALSLLACALIGIPFSLWPGGSVHTLTDQYLKSLAIFWLLGSVVSSMSRLRRLLWTLAASSLLIAYTGIKAYVAGDLFDGRIAVKQAGLSSALTANPNLLALVLCLFLPLAAGLALAEKSAWRRSLAWCIVGVGVAGVVLTFSRAGFLALAVETGVFLFLLIRRRSMGRAAVLIVTAALALVLLPAGLTQRFSTAFGDNQDASASTRRRDQVVAVQYILTHPVIGSGLGTDLLVMRQIRDVEMWTRIHDVYLVYGVELGMPGLALFLSLIFVSFRTAKRVERAAKVRRPDLSAIAGCVQVSLAGFVVWGFFDPGAYYFHFYYISGLAVGLKAVAERESLAVA